MKRLRHHSDSVSRSIVKVFSLFLCLTLASPEAGATGRYAIGPINSPEQAADLVRILQSSNVTFDRQIKAGRESLGYIVVTPPLSDSTSGKVTVADLKAAGEEDVLYIGVGDYINRVSAGVYKTERTANRRRESLLKLGFSFEVLERSRRVQQMWLDVDEMPREVVTDIQSLNFEGLMIDAIEGEIIPEVALPQEPTSETGSDTIPKTETPPEAKPEETSTTAEPVSSESDVIIDSSQAQDKIEYTPTTIAESNAATEDSDASAPQRTSPSSLDQQKSENQPVVVDTSVPAPSNNLMMMLLLGLFFILVSALSYFVYLYYFSRPRLATSESSSQSITELVPDALNSVSEGLLVLDNDLNIVMANEPFSRMSRLSTETLTGSGVEVLEFMTAEGAELRHFEMPWYKVRDEGKPRMDIRLRLILDNGQHAALISNSSPILADQNRVAGILVSFKDITDLERKEQQLEQLQQEIIEERIAATGLLQEQLPEPINALGLLANSFSQGELPNQDDSRQWLASLYEAGPDTLNMLSDLLTYSQADADLIHNQPVEFSALSFIDQLHDALETAASNGKVVLVPDLEQSLITADVNLLIKAIRIMADTAQHQGMPVYVELFTSEQYLIVQVTSSQTGVDDDALRDVPGRLTELESELLPPAASLGLALAARMSQIMGGRLLMSADPFALVVEVPVEQTAIQQLMLPEGITIAEVTEHNRELEDRQGALEEEKSELLEEKNTLEQEKTALQSVKTDLENVKSELEQANTNLINEKTDLATEKAELVQDRSELLQVNTDLEDQMAQLAQQKLSLEQQKTELEQQQQRLVEQHSVLSTNKESLEQSLASLQQNLEETLKAKQDAENAYSAAIADKGEADLALADAQQQATEASTALAEQLQSHNNIALQIDQLQQELLAEKQQREIDIQEERHRLEQLQENELSRREVEIQRKVKTEIETEIVRLKAERDREIGERETKLNQLAEASTVARNEIQVLAGLSEQANSKVSQLSEEVVNLKQLLSSTEQEQAAVKAQYHEEVTQLKQQLEQEQQQAESVITAHQAQITESSEQLDSLQTEISRLESDIAARELSKQEAVSQAQEQVNEVNQQLQEATRQKEEERQRREQLEADNQQRIEALHTTITTMESDLELAQQRDQASAEAISKVTELTTELGALQQELTEARHQLNANEERHNSASQAEIDELQKLKELLASAEEKLLQTEMEKSLSERQATQEVSTIIDELNQVRSQAEQEAAQRQQIEQASASEISELQSQLEAFRTSHFTDMQERADQETKANQHLEMSTEALSAAQDQLSDLKGQKASLEELAKKRADTLVKAVVRLKVSAKREKAAKAEIQRLRRIVARMQQITKAKQTADNKAPETTSPSLTSTDDSLDSNTSDISPVDPDTDVDTADLMLAPIPTEGLELAPIDEAQSQAQPLEKQEPEPALKPAPAKEPQPEPALEREPVPEPAEQTKQSPPSSDTIEFEDDTKTGIALRKKMAINFLVRLQHQVNIMRTATFEDNLMEVLSITHWIRDEANNLKQADLMNMTQKMEHALRHRDRSQITSVIEELDKAASHLLREAKQADSPTPAETPVTAEPEPIPAVVFEFSDPNKAELAENFILTLGTNLLEMELALREEAAPGMKKLNKWISRYSSILGFDDIRSISSDIEISLETRDWDEISIRLEILKELYSHIEIVRV